MQIISSSEWTQIIKPKSNNTKHKSEEKSLSVQYTKQRIFSRRPC